MKHYQKSFVAFIDILGFKEIIDSKTCDDIYKLIDDFINKSYEIENINTHSFYLAENVNQTSEKSELVRFDRNYQNLFHFSDTLIWTYPLNFENGTLEYFKILSETISHLRVLQQVLFDSGIIIRGGLTIGDIFITNERFFGPGIVEAYQLEKDAFYPRIKIDDVLLKNISNQYYDKILRQQIEGKENDFYLSIFSLNKNFISILNKDELGDKEVCEILYSRVIENMKKYKGIIINGILNDDPKVKEKYVWMKERYAETLEMADNPKYFDDKFFKKLMLK